MNFTRQMCLKSNFKYMLFVFMNKPNKAAGFDTSHSIFLKCLRSVQFVRNVGWLVLICCPSIDNMTIVQVTTIYGCKCLRSVQFLWNVGWLVIVCPMPIHRQYDYCSALFCVETMKFITIPLLSPSSSW